MTRITFMGEEIQSRDNRGRFSKIRLHWGWYVVLGGLMVVAFNFHFNSWYNREISYVQPVYAGASLEGKVEAMKEGILDRLMACEAAGHSEDEGIVVIDNGQLSWGQYQFFRPTVIHFYELLYNQTITMKEAGEIALDTSRARSLASDIIWKVEGGVWEWENCAKKLGLAPEITLIKKLEQ